MGAAESPSSHCSDELHPPQTRGHSKSVAGGNRLHSKAPKDSEEIRPSASKLSARATTRQQPAALPSHLSQQKTDGSADGKQGIADSGQ